MRAEEHSEPINIGCRKNAANGEKLSISESNFIILLQKGGDLYDTI
jgi:hypothetical protein